MKILPMTGFCVLICSLMGCEISKQARQQSDETISKVERLLPVASLPTATRNVSPVKFNKGIYVGGQAVEKVNGEPLPAKYERDNGITISRLHSISIRELAYLITKQTEIPVILANVSASSSKQDGGSDETSSFALGPVPVGFTFDSSDSNRDGQETLIGAGRKVTDEVFPLNFSGKLSTLLNIACAHYNYAWRYADGKIIIDSLVNRSFDVPVLPLISTLSIGIGTGNSSASGQSAGSSGHTASTAAVSDIWGELNGGLASILGISNGGNSFSISKTTGVVNISADPITINRVASFLRNFNERLKDQVAISVTVYSVVLRDAERFDFNVAGLFNDPSKFGFAVGNSSAESIVSSAESGVSGLGWALLDTNSKFTGSHAFVGALSERGDVSVVTSASVTTLNGVPVPLQVGQDRDYVSQIDVTTEDGVTTTDITTDTVSAGFNLHLVPLVDRSGSLTLQFGINISELSGSEDGFDTFSANGQTVQLRRVNQRNFVQQARIPHQKTLVLAGFEQVRSSTNKQGVGTASFPLLGGGQSSISEREIIVITITPTVLKLR